MTSEPGRIIGGPEANDSQHLEKEDNIDPEKFKKVLETDPDQRRNRKRQEEEALPTTTLTPQEMVDTSEKKVGNPFELRTSTSVTVSSRSSNVNPSSLPQSVEETPQENEPAGASKTHNNASHSKKPSSPKQLNKNPLTPSKIGGVIPSAKQLTPATSSPSKTAKKNTPPKSKKNIKLPSIKAAPVQPLKEEVVKNDKKVESIAIAPSAPHELASTVLEPTSVSPLSRQPDLFQLYSHMVGFIQTISTKSGDLHMEITLNSPQFEKSPFYGMQIVINRFSTALDTYHIEFFASEKGLSLLTPQAMNSLQEAFVGLPFQVRFRTPSLLSSRSLEKEETKKVRRVKPKKREE